MQVRPVPPPDSLGKYRIVERLSHSAVADVYKARVDGLAGFQRTFVVKRIHEALMKDDAFASAFVEEAKLSGLLSHTNIVQILDLGEADGTTYIAMELVEGFDLDRILTRARDRGIAIPDAHAVLLVIEVLKALEYAHHRQVMRGGTLVPLDILHRDVSPSNILVSKQGEVKLGDFGIARATRAVLEADPPDDLHDFMSPEQIEGEGSRIRSAERSVRHGDRSLRAPRGTSPVRPPGSRGDRSRDPERRVPAHPERPRRARADRRSRARGRPRRLATRTRRR